MTSGLQLLKVKTSRRRLKSPWHSAMFFAVLSLFFVAFVPFWLCIVRGFEQSPVHWYVADLEVHLWFKCISKVCLRTSYLFVVLDPSFVPVRLFNFLLQEPWERGALVLYWAIMLTLSIYYIFETAKHGKEGRIIIRKYYHILAVMIFAPGLLLQVRLQKARCVTHGNLERSNK